jgi:cellulose synthase/poly-beta-1,6-N-acetylglucosamine synthase-like glycosyltransferase
MTLAALAVFALCLGVCLYVYAGYPALIWTLARLRPRPVQGGDASLVLSVIIPVHDEAAVIEAKLANTLAAHYPPHGLEVLVASDGSTDATDAIVAAFPDPRVRLLRLERRGKAHALNRAAAEARGEVLVFMDANAMLEPDALRRLAWAFADPEVGGVCGNKKQRVPEGADATEQGENLYWRYDKWQKALESRIGSIFAADGTIYAVRAALFVPIADPAQADDIAVSARVVLQGRRLIYEAAAVAWEPAPVEGREEFHRKVRVTNHSVRALLNLGRALWTSGFYSVELLSHKLLRHLVPFFLIPLFASNAVLARHHPLLALSLALQVLFYALALAGFALRHHRLGGWRLLAVPYYFCLVNAAALLGVLSILRGQRLQAWTPRGGLEAGEGGS